MPDGHRATPYGMIDCSIAMMPPTTGKNREARLSRLKPYGETA
jgi:hypothetical protein